MSSKKPRKNKLDARQFTPAVESTKKKEKDWSFDDIARSKGRGRSY